MADQILEWFGEQRYSRQIEQVRSFWAGRGRAIVSVYPEKCDYRQVFDEQQMLRDAPKHLKAQAEMPGISLPNVWADFGTISTARYWGGLVHQPQDEEMRIYIEPAAKTLDEALELTPLAVDDPTMDAARAIGFFRKLSEQLQTDKLWLRTPDAQGVLSTAGLIVDQQELFIDMIAAPDKVHAFLQRVCDFLIDFTCWLRDQTGGRICGNVWAYTFLPPNAVKPTRRCLLS